MRTGANYFLNKYFCCHTKHCLIISKLFDRYTKYTVVIYSLHHIPILFHVK